jgi:hypothetical protein
VWAELSEQLLLFAPSIVRWFNLVFAQASPTAPMRAPSNNCTSPLDHNLRLVRRLSHTDS